MPTALDAGWYHSNGFHDRRHRQYVRATGLPAPSTWASAARSSGAMVAVECARKSASYERHVSGGVFESAPLTGKNSSVGLRTTWYVQFTTDQRASRTIAITTTRSASGNAMSTRNALCPKRTRRRNRVGRARRARVFPDGIPAARGADATAIYLTMPRRAYSPRISRSRRLRAVMRSFIFSERDVGRARFLGGADEELGRAHV